MTLRIRKRSGRRRRASFRRVPGWCWALALAMVSAVATVPGRAAEEGVSKEYAVKAAFLYNFTKFIEWPATAFKSDTSPLIIGILGHDPFDGELGRIVKRRKLNGREIEVRHVTTVEDAKGIQLLFVPAGEEKRWEMLSEALKAYPVLTVSESVLDGTSPTMIRFFIDADKV